MRRTPLTDDEKTLIALALSARMTAARIADALKIDRVTVYRHIRRAKLKHKAARSAA